MNMPITSTQAIEQMHQLLDQQSKAYRAMPVSTQRMDLDTIRTCLPLAAVSTRRAFSAMASRSMRAAGRARLSIALA